MAPPLASPHATPSASHHHRSEHRQMTHTAKQNGELSRARHAANVAVGAVARRARVDAMSQAAPPALTVRYDGSERTFAAGHDVVVGRDLRADMRITHPLISRAHLLLRYDQGRWLAIDNGSLNGTFVNGRRVPVVELRDGQSINIGNPDGPLLTFQLGQHAGLAGRPPITSSMRVGT